MIVVTGSCRTGTSLVMQSLRLMGINVAGDVYDPTVPCELTPGGCWELPFEETENGIQHDRYRGKAVKLFGLQLSRTPRQHVAKLIVCTRDYQDAIRSTVRLLRAQQRFRHLPPTADVAEAVYRLNYKYIAEYPFDFPLRIVYDDMVSSDTRDRELLKLKEYAGAPLPIDAAAENVKVRT